MVKLVCRDAHVTTVPHPGGLLQFLDDHPFQSCPEPGCALPAYLVSGNCVLCGRVLAPGLVTRKEFRVLEACRDEESGRLLKDGQLICGQHQLVPRDGLSPTGEAGDRIRDKYLRRFRHPVRRG